jgi:two-component system, OmpR family, alkaline phosphatase synthesis response regulator PhoP
MVKKILIAEDDLDSRALLLDVLKPFHRFNVEVIVAEDGEQAVTLAEREKPDLMLLDVMMPGMSGLEVCEKVKANPELTNTYIIMITSMATHQDRMNAVMVEADEYITKPYKINLILERVKQVLNVAPL